MVFKATSHEYEAGHDKKLIRERRISYFTLFFRPFTISFV